jgi:hypothetical protein
VYFGRVPPVPPAEPTPGLTQWGLMALAGCWPPWALVAQAQARHPSTVSVGAPDGSRSRHRILSMDYVFDMVGLRIGQDVLRRRS